MGLFHSQRFSDIRAVASGPVLTIGLTASMGGFLFGADTGQISGFLIMRDFLRRFAQYKPEEEEKNGVPYGFNNVREGLIVGLLSIGCLIGALIAAPISNRLGRRMAMIVLCGVFLIGNTIQIASFHAWYQVMIGRFICGLSVGGLSVLVPVYVSETVPKQIRGALVATYQLFVTMGILTSYCVNLGTSHVDDTAWSWRAALIIGYLWALILMGGMFILPETPRYLLSQGRKDDCIKALTWIAGRKNKNNNALIESQFQEMSSAIHEEKSFARKSFFSSFDPKDKIMYRTILGFGLQMFQQLTGANYFFYYGTTIFQSVGLTNPYVTQIILGGVNVVSTFPGLWFIERYGRRKPLIIGGLWQCAWLIVFAAVGSQADPNSSTVGSILILSACMFIFGFASTWGPGVWVAIGEIFPLRVRSHSASFATAGNWSWNFLLAFFTPYITSSIGYRYGYVFAGCNLIGVLMVFFFYYESSNLTLEQVDEMYCDKDTKPWKSGSWVPKGFASRREAAETEKERAVVDAGLREDAAHIENTNRNGSMDTHTTKESVNAI
ncbi:hexose transporter hxt1 [Arthrobotrys musiformis]|uniref:Hexose transporter hxt1 n=1 Tax=Arthrobotrys musiformis TaxID=47236 RepID=A0AAV9WB03_9PEZI